MSISQVSWGWLLKVTPMHATHTGDTHSDSDHTHTDTNTDPHIHRDTDAQAQTTHCWENENTRSHSLNGSCVPAPC